VDSGMVSRSADFGRNWPYGVGTAGTPNQVEQGFCNFCCTKSSMSAPSLHLAHFMHTL
jgi:hypothetical protein